MAINYPELQQVFQRTLGRPPREDEAQFFIDQAKKNNFSAFEIGDILTGSPEAQRSQTQRDISGFQEMAGASDQFVLGKAQESLLSKFRGAGRSASGSAYAAAFADVAQKLAAQRSSQLADIYNQRAAGIAGQEQAMGTGLRQRGYNLEDARTKRAQELEDFYLQRDAYNDQLNRMNRSRRNSAFGQLGGAVAGGIIGSSFGQPVAGMQMGSQIGGGLFG